MGKRRDRKQMIQREKERVPVFFRAIHLRGNCSHSICRSHLCGKGYLYPLDKVSEESPSWSGHHRELRGNIWKAAKKDIMIPLSADYKNRCGR